MDQQANNLISEAEFQRTVVEMAEAFRVPLRDIREQDLDRYPRW